jgi:hypothetical protein
VKRGRDLRTVGEVCGSNESEERRMGQDEALDGGKKMEELGRFGGGD